LQSYHQSLREVVFRGEAVTTGIFKEPIEGRAKLGRLNLDGDKQADLTVHGGEDKALYAYAWEYYGFWRDQLPGTIYLMECLVKILLLKA
jgi:MOSC domain-containing protein YiiM